MNDLQKNYEIDTYGMSDSGISYVTEDVWDEICKIEGIDESWTPEEEFKILHEYFNQHDKFHTKRFPLRGAGPCLWTWKMDPIEYSGLSIKQRFKRRIQEMLELGRTGKEPVPWR